MTLFSKLLSPLGVDAEEADLYQTLVEHGAVTVGALAKERGVPRPSLYGTLRKLQDKGLVTSTLRSGVLLFAAEAPSKVAGLYEQRVEELTTAQKKFSDAAARLERGTSNHIIGPRFQIFEGVEGVKHVLKDMLLYRDMETIAYWPIRDMLDILSADFFRYLNKERIKRNLATRAIWPERQIVKVKDHPYLGVGTAFKRTIRIAPKQINFSMGYWVYGNKAAFISSRRESFGFIIESSELVEMLQSQFEVIWNMSKELKVAAADMAPFMRELP